MNTPTFRRPDPSASIGALVVAAAAVIAVLAAASTATTASAAQPHPFAGHRTATVMTRNLYLGTELQPLFAAPSLPALFGAVANGYAQVQASRPAERIDAVAAEIAAAEPDLVALQEATLFRTDVPSDGPATPGETVTYDFLRLLLDALASRGASYELVERSRAPTSSCRRESRPFATSA
jgi:hypothetical protein